ncbi:hypothetical protein [Kordia sp.]|uniref:hypothetical protein n=1 Tax=Kordia sp. TaxID=1965332 RepID=UPI003B5C38C4
MRQSRKETAWKKSRKFGDVKGGRKRPKLADNIFKKQHNFLAPKQGEETPIFIIDNPSRDFFFPITVAEIKEFFAKLPSEHTEHITHIWLRKISNKEHEKEDGFQGCFICGSEVNLIVLHPFPKDLKMKFGHKKPSNKTLKWYTPYEPELVYTNKEWVLKWTEEKIKKYYLEGLLLFEIGHQINSVYKRYWSSNYIKKRGDDFANNFAYYWGDQIRTEFK